jgi:hypothetical protein
MSISKVIKKYKIDKQPNDFSFWQSKSYEERLDALEQIRKEYNLWRYNAELRIVRSIMAIGIGRSLTAPPSHTTLHPPQADCAIRLIRQVQILGNESPSDLK